MIAAVTGATGFIGRALATRLAAGGHRVRCLVRDQARAAWMAGTAGLEPVTGDVLRPETLPSLLEGAEAVFHLAGLTKAARDADFQAVNADGTGNLAAAAAALPRPPSFVLVSSLAVAGPHTSASPAREGEPPAPLTPYGRSKLRGEEQLRERGRGLRAAVIRPPVVYGPGDRDMLLLFRWAARRVVPLPRGGRLELSLVHVDDLVEALVLAGTDDRAAGRTWYVSDGVVHTSRELAGKLLAAAGGGRVFPIPAPAVRLAGFLGDLATRVSGRAVLLSGDKADESLRDGWVCDDRPTREELGWRSRVELEEGVRSTMAWYRERGWL